MGNTKDLESLHVTTKVETSMGPFVDAVQRKPVEMTLTLPTFAVDQLMCLAVAVQHFEQQAAAVHHHCNYFNRKIFNLFFIFSKYLRKSK